MTVDRVTKRLVLVFCGAVPFFFFLHANWARAALLGYFLTGFAVAALADEFPPVTARWFWKAPIAVTAIHLAIVTALVWLDFSVPQINRMPRMLYGFAAFVIVLECRLAFWIIDICESRGTRSARN
jgi:hypothetical protein